MECLHGSTRREYVSSAMLFGSMEGLSFSEAWATARDRLAAATLSGVDPRGLADLRETANVAINAALERDYALRQQDASSEYEADAMELRLCA